MQYNHIFTTESNNPAVRPTKSVTTQMQANMQRQVNSLNFQLSRKPKSQQTSKYVFKTMKTTDEANSFIDDEIQTFSNKRKKWSSIPACSQWVIIEDFLRNKNIEKNEMQIIKDRFQTNKLIVDYNQKQNSIVKITFDNKSIC